MSLIADQNGRISGRFTIPANVPSGTKAVEAVGSGGTRADVRYTAQGVEVIETKRRIVTRFIRERRDRDRRRADPLAQTFSLNEARYLTGIDIWLAKIGDPNNPILVQLRETATGMPTQSVIAEASAPLVDASEGAWLRVNFPDPVFVDAAVEYALVVLSDDAEHALGIAELGKFDSHAQTWVTAQPYTVGVLLSSSNASTWTPHQNADLAFKLYAAKFTQSSRSIDFGNMSANRASDLMVLGEAAEPTVGTSVAFKLRKPDGGTYPLAVGQPLTLADFYSGDLSVQADIGGTQHSSGQLDPLVQVLVGELESTGDYVSRAIPAGDGVRVVVTVDCILPGSSSLAVDCGGVDAWQPMNKTSGTGLGNGWAELVFELTGYSAADVRVRLTLSGDPRSRPQVKNLRVMVI